MTLSVFFGGGACCRLAVLVFAYGAAARCVTARALLVVGVVPVVEAAFGGSAVGAGLVEAAA